MVQWADKIDRYEGDKGTRRWVGYCVSGIVDSNPPRRQCLVDGVGDDVCCEFQPLCDLVNEGNREIMVQRQSTMTRFGKVALWKSVDFTGFRRYQHLQTKNPKAAFRRLKVCPQSNLLKIQANRMHLRLNLRLWSWVSRTQFDPSELVWSFVERKR